MTQQQLTKRIDIAVDGMSHSLELVHHLEYTLTESGWALTLLSPQNLSYASTAQTIGLGIGNALAFTVFLAFNSVDFSSVSPFLPFPRFHANCLGQPDVTDPRSNRYFRTEPLPYGLISLGGYIRFWGVVFIIVTLWLAVYKVEDPVSENDPDMDVKKVYKVMWSIIRLKSECIVIVHNPAFFSY